MAETRQSKQTSGTVLVIDDAPVTIDLLTQCLQSQGYRVLIAGSGGEGVRIAREILPDLILLDILMPDVDGFETCRRLKADSRTASLPVIFLTSSTEEEDRIRAFAVGGLDYVTKPVLLPELLARVGVQVRASRLSRECRRANEALADEAARWYGLFEGANDGIAVIDLNGRAREANQSFADMLGYSREELCERHVWDWNADRGRQEILATLRELSCTPATFETRHRRKDGTLYEAEVSAGSIEWRGERLIFCMHRDITERKRAEQSLRIAATVFDSAHEGIVITDAHERIVEVNRMFTELTGYTRDEVLGRTPRLLHSGHQGRPFYEAMWGTLEAKDEWYGEIWNRKKSGEIFAEMIHISAVRGPSGDITHYIGIFSDTTAEKAHQRQIEYLTHYDALTQLPNRILFRDRLCVAQAQAQRSGKVLAVAHLDLDHFKLINDTVGHVLADRVLMEVARRIRTTVRGGDTVARVSGDEFVLLLADLDSPEECRRSIENLLVLLALPYRIQDHELRTAASIGVTLFPDDDADPDTLLRHADQAMCTAKEAGRNRYHVFDRERDRRASSRHELLTAIRTGLLQNEFVLYYQPSVDMRRGVVHGVEALVRWQHPARGLLLPGDFLPLIDEDPLAIAFGDWVLSEALRQLDGWRKAGTQLRISVNISGPHLLADNFLPRLAELLQRYPGLPPEAIELEVLESTAFDDLDKVSRVIEDAHRLGVSFALDDFGTGYSSLAYFKRLPLHAVKIDQSFVRGMLADDEDLSIVESVVAMTRAFKRNVIAEGVETPEHGVILLQMRCDCAQGYGIAPPMPAEQVPDWTASFRAHPLWSPDLGYGLRQEDLPLVLAEYYHRAWIDHVTEFLQDDDHNRCSPPQLEPHFCRFGVWCDGIGSERYSRFPEFQRLQQHHERMHRLACKLQELKRSGRTVTARKRLRHLLHAHDELLQQLTRLTRVVQQSCPQAHHH